MRSGCSGARGSPRCSASAARFSSSTARSCAVQADVSGAARGARERPQCLGHVAVELGRDRARVLALGLGQVGDDQLAVGPEGLAEAQPEVQRDARDDRDVGALQPALRARRRTAGGRRPGTRARAR